MSKKNEPNWGAFLSRYTVVWALLRDTLAKLEINLEEMVPWLAGQGREHFVHSVTMLGKKFQKARQVRATAETEAKSAPIPYKTFVVSDIPTVSQLIERIEVKLRQVTNYAKDLMSKPEFAESIAPGTYKLVAIRGDEFATDAERTTAAVFAKAKERKYRKLPAFLAAIARAEVSEYEQGALRVAFMHEPIVDSYGSPSVLGLRRDVSVEYLRTYDAGPGGQWLRDDLFVFLAPQES